MTKSIRRFTQNSEMNEVVSEVRRTGVAVIENLFESAVMDLLFKLQDKVPNIKAYKWFAIRDEIAEWKSTGNRE